jgi:hypothetical protein
MFPLLVGALVYVFMKPFYSWIGNISLSYFKHEALVQKINNSTQSWPKFIVTVIRNNLADFCWTYSIASALFLFNESALKKTTVKKLFTILLGIALGEEVVQVWMPFYFTFDFWDVVATFSGVCMSYFFLMIVKNKNST